LRKSRSCYYHTSAFVGNIRPAAARSKSGQVTGHKQPEMLDEICAGLLPTILTVWRWFSHSSADDQIAVGQTMLRIPQKPYKTEA
jgi:hypothetical protein